MTTDVPIFGNRTPADRRPSLSVQSEIRNPKSAIPRAFTLVEMTISLVIVGIILAASGSLVMVASRAVSSDASNVGADATSARAATSRIVEDLKVATAVTEKTAKAVTMTVPDRDGDGMAETIRYAWSGVAGDPLTRSYNGVTGTLAENVKALDFTYLTKQVGKPPPAESAEQALAAYTDTSSPKTYGLKDTNWPVQYFKPTLSAKAISWKVTRCRWRLQGVGLLGTATARLRYADSDGKPTGADLATADVLTTGLLSTAGGAWVDFDLSPDLSLDVNKAVCLMLTTTSTSKVAEVIYVDIGSAAETPSLMWTDSTNGGSSYGSPSTKNRAVFGVWGTETVQERETLDFQPLPPPP